MEDVNKVEDASRPGTADVFLGFMMSTSGRQEEIESLSNQTRRFRDNREGLTHFH